MTVRSRVNRSVLVQVIDSRALEIGNGNPSPAALRDGVESTSIVEGRLRLLRELMIRFLTLGSVIVEAVLSTTARLLIAPGSVGEGNRA